MLAHAPSLADLAADVALGDVGPEALHRAFLDAIVYCERPDAPGFRMLGPVGGGVVPVFTSPEQLALARGAVEWFALSGAELLDLLPTGYDVVLDLGGPTPLRLRPSALTTRTALDVRREIPP